jgi:hypothetical protein
MREKVKRHCGRHQRSESRCPDCARFDGYADGRAGIAAQVLKLMEPQNFPKRLALIRELCREATKP